MMNIVNTKLRSELNEIKREERLFETIPCDEQENAEYAKMQNLPSNIRAATPYQNNGVWVYTFERLIEIEMTAEEANLWLQMKQYKRIKTIKKCVVYFTVLSIIAECAALLLFLLMLL